MLRSPLSAPVPKEDAKGVSEGWQQPRPRAPVLVLFAVVLLAILGSCLLRSLSQDSWREGTSDPLPFGAWGPGCLSGFS